MPAGLLVRAVAPVAAAALALTAGIAPAGAVTSHRWHVVLTTGPAGGVTTLRSVVATSPGDAWAAGSICSPCGSTTAIRLLVEHRRLGPWRARHLPEAIATGTDGSVLSLGASSSRNAWIFTSSAAGAPEAVRWTGARWIKRKVPTWAYLANLSGDVRLGSGVFSKQNVWLFSEFLTSRRPYAAHWNGTQWTRRRLPVDPYVVSGLSRRNIWAAGATARSAATASAVFAAMHWNGRSWRTIRLPMGDDPNVSAMAATSARRVWIEVSRPSGTVLLLHRLGGRWHRVRIPLQNGLVPAGMAQDGHGGIWLPLIGPAPKDATLLYHYSHGRWTKHATPADQGTRTQPNGFAWIPGTRSLWAVGQAIPLNGADTVRAVILGNGS